MNVTLGMRKAKHQCSGVRGKILWGTKLIINATIKTGQHLKPEENIVTAPLNRHFHN